MTEAMAPPGASFLATRKGQLTLAFLCLVAFMDFMGFAIMTVALPTIQRDLHFSQQNLQWVISGYTVTYGGFLLLGGRLADLLGRRVTLVIGTAVFLRPTANHRGDPGLAPPGTAGTRGSLRPSEKRCASHPGHFRSSEPQDGASQTSRYPL